MKVGAGADEEVILPVLHQQLKNHYPQELHAMTYKHLKNYICNRQFVISREPITKSSRSVLNDEGISFYQKASEIDHISNLVYIRGRYSLEWQSEEQQEFDLTF